MAIRINVHETGVPAGKLLVASPHVQNLPYQHRVVLLLGEHGPSTFGLVVNNDLRERMKQLRDQLRIKASQRVALPVDQHTQLVHWGNGKLAQEIKAGIWMVTTPSAHMLEGDNDLWIDMVRMVGKSVLQDTLGIKHFPQDATLN